MSGKKEPTSEIETLLQLQRLSALHTLPSSSDLPKVVANYSIERSNAAKWRQEYRRVCLPEHRAVFVSHYIARGCCSQM